MSKFEVGQKVIVTVAERNGKIGEVIDVISVRGSKEQHLYWDNDILFSDGYALCFTDDELELAPAEAPAAPDALGSGAADDTRAVILPTLLSGASPDAKATILAAYIEAREATLKAQLAAAEQALRRCINADVVGYWSAEEVAQRYFAAQDTASDSP